MSFDNNGFEFGEFFLDTEERALIKNGEKIPLTPKAYELLLELIKNSGQIISKESLMDSVWAGTIVEEGNLPFTIRLLRRALSDDARQPRFIEGLPRRGYRFVAEVNEAPDRQNPGQVNGSQTEKKNFVVENGHISQQRSSLLSTKHAPSRKFRYILALSLFAVLVFGVLAFYPWQNPSIGENRAVPFQNSRITKLSSGKALQTALSPDGKQVAYVLEGKEGQSLWLRRTTIESSVQIIPPAGVDFLSVNFSRDGDIIYYVTSERRKFDGTLYSVPVLGGSTRNLFEHITSQIGLSHD